MRIESALSSWSLVVAFLTLADERHFGRAAARLGISRQTVSRHVSRLEAQLGEPLIVRTTRRIELTPAGSLLHSEAGSALKAMEDALIRVRLGAGRRLSIALSTDLPRVWETRVQDWIVRRGAPVLLERRAPDDAIGLLRTRALDLALLTFELPDLRGVVVADEPTVLLIPDEHPAARRPVFRPGDAPDLLVAVTDAGEETHHRRTVALVHGDPGLPYVVAPRVGTIVAGLVHTARTHRAAAYIPRGTVQEIDTSGLTAVALDPPRPLPVTLIARAGLEVEPQTALAAHLSRG